LLLPPPVLPLPVVEPPRPAPPEGSPAPPVPMELEPPFPLWPGPISPPPAQPMSAVLTTTPARNDQSFALCRGEFIRCPPTIGIGLLIRKRKCFHDVETFTGSFVSVSIVQKLFSEMRADRRRSPTCDDYCDIRPFRGTALSARR